MSRRLRSTPYTYVFTVEGPLSFQPLSKHVVKRVHPDGVEVAEDETAPECTFREPPGQPGDQ